MDPILNPYTPGAGSRPPALAGREEQLRSFEILLGRLRQGKPEKGMLITGLRGVGKTVLLGEFRNMVEAQRLIAAEAEITHETQLRALAAGLMRKVVLQLRPTERAKDAVKRAVAVFRAFTIKLPDGYEIGVDVDALRGIGDSGKLGDDLPDLFQAVGEAARERKSAVILLLDEIQFLTRAEMEALIASIHRVSQRNLPLTIVGAGLPQLPKLAAEAKSYAERLFDFRVIDKLSPAAAREALERPAAKEGVRFDPAATAQMVRLTEGYPYFLQEYGRHVWNLSSGPVITEEDARQAWINVLSQLDESFFRVRVSRATRVELQYMSAMADLGAGPYRSGAIAEKLGKMISAVAPVRNTLIHKGLIYSPQHGVTMFTVPRFDDFLRRNYPFRPASRSRPSRRSTRR